MKFVSIIGDSISTYMGFNPFGYSVFYDEYNAQRNNMSSVYDTWWAQVNQFLHAYICVNNSYSGSKVSGNNFPSANCEQRLSLLHTNQYSPDLILIYIGFNDFGNGIKITSEHMNDEMAFFESYYNMLKTVQKNYPKSRILCGTLMQGFVKDNPSWTFPHKWAGISIDEYNAAIKIAAKLAGVELIDLAALNMHYETLDGAHPTKDGHYTIAQAWISCLKKRFSSEL